jgi:hypothetical protein
MMAWMFFPSLTSSKWFTTIDLHKQTKQKHFCCARTKKGLEVEQIEALVWFLMRSKPCGAGGVLPSSCRTPFKLIDAALVIYPRLVAAGLVVALSWEPPR